MNPSDSQAEPRNSKRVEDGSESSRTDSEQRQSRAYETFEEFQIAHPLPLEHFPGLMVPDDEEVVQAKARIEILKVIRSQKNHDQPLQTRLSQEQSFISPFRRILPEILSLIVRTLYEIEPIFEQAYQSYFPNVLACVCSRFRSLIMADPQLCARVVLPIYGGLREPGVQDLETLPGWSEQAYEWCDTCNGRGKWKNDACPSKKSHADKLDKAIEQPKFCGKWFDMMEAEYSRKLGALRCRLDAIQSLHPGKPTSVLLVVVDCRDRSIPSFQGFWDLHPSWSWDICENVKELGHSVALLSSQVSSLRIVCDDDVDYWHAEVVEALSGMLREGRWHSLQHFECSIEDAGDDRSEHDKVILAASLRSVKLTYSPPRPVMNLNGSHPRSIAIHQQLDVATLVEFLRCHSSVESLQLRNNSPWGAGQTFDGQIEAKAKLPRLRFFDTDWGDHALKYIEAENIFALRIGKSPFRSSRDAGENQRAEMAEVSSTATAALAEFLDDQKADISVLSMVRLKPSTFADVVKIPRLSNLRLLACESWIADKDDSASAILETLALSKSLPNLTTIVLLDMDRRIRSGDMTPGPRRPGWSFVGEVEVDDDAMARLSELRSGARMASIGRGLAKVAVERPAMRAACVSDFCSSSDSTRTTLLHSLRAIPALKDMTIADAVDAEVEDENGQRRLLSTLWDHGEEWY